MKQQGTGIMVLYNLWEDDQGQLELDFDADQYSYVAILYLQLPPHFKIILQGHEVQHHRLVDDPICPHELTCRPQGCVEHVITESDECWRSTLCNLLMTSKELNAQPFWHLWSLACCRCRSSTDKLLNSFLAGQTIARRWGMQAIRAVRRVYHLHLQGKWGVTTRRWVCVLHQFCLQFLQKSQPDSEEMEELTPEEWHWMEGFFSHTGSIH
ncbi:unnamed protein product [Sphagnum troendelagicum]|uniref:Morc S5 domain-containing protein n=1 Tax=Sphagnum troendelagicum TaxID=128251 RepID=A0ABP0TZ84_9BRYO